MHAGAGDEVEDLAWAFAAAEGAGFTATLVDVLAIKVATHLMPPYCNPAALLCPATINLTFASPTSCARFALALSVGRAFMPAAPFAFALALSLL
jgi:hypothetical protein